MHLQLDESNDIRFSRLSTSDGLSHTRATSIVQDQQGFMWFGTSHGLDRYDGYTYKVFLHDPALKDSLSCVYIRALFMNRAGTLWVGCDRSVEKYDAATETFEHYFLGNPAANSSPAFVFSINEDREGTLWVSTADGLYRLDPSTGRIARFAHDPANPSSLSSNNVYLAGEDRESRFWVSDGGDIEEMDRRTGRVIRRIAIEHSDPRAVLFYEDHFGTFWITYVLQGQETGLAVLDRKTNLPVRSLKTSQLIGLAHTFRYAFFRSLVAPSQTLRSAPGVWTFSAMSQNAAHKSLGANCADGTSRGSADVHPRRGWRA